MTTHPIPYRPHVDFCTTQCFSVQYGNKNPSLKCWQKVLIVALGILLVGIGGLALSYYWRNRLVEQLYDVDYRGHAGRGNQEQTSFSSVIPLTIEDTQEVQQSA